MSQKSWSPKYGFSYKRSKEHSISQLDVYFSNMRSKGTDLLSMSSIRPQINYSYQRKVSDNIWIGGFMDHQTLLNFPVTSSGKFNNNPINYLITQSIGPKVSYIQETISGNGNRLQLLASAEVPLLNYVIQPEWAHPYPREYLNEDEFKPNRDGLAWPLMKSGRVVSLNKYRSLNLKLGLYYYINSNIKLGLDIHSDLMYANTVGKYVSMTNHDIMLGATYIH